MPGHPASTPDPVAGWPRVRPVAVGRVWVWGVLAWLMLAPLIWLRPPRISGNVSSRYMTIERITARGTLAIERSPLLAQSGSPDVVMFGTHLYSDKPPVLPALAVPIDFALRAAGVRFTRSAAEFTAGNFAFTWLIPALASSLALVGFRALLQGVDLAPWAADMATIALGVGSPLLTYAVTFNNHSVAAGCVICAWALILLERPGRRRGWTRFLAGLLAGLAATIDLPVGCLTLVGLGMIELARGPWAAIAYAAGALGPLLLHAGLQSLVTGTPLPAEMYPAAFAYPGSYWLSSEGNWHDPRPRWQFGLDFLVGRQGAFTIFPALWFGVVGLIGAGIGRQPQRPAALIIGGTWAILIGYYVWGVRRTDFAGGSYGCRHLLAIMPLVAVFAVRAVVGLRARWLIVGLAIGAVAVGVVYSVAGAAEPWSRIEERAKHNPWLAFVQRGVLYPDGTYRGEHR